MAHGKDKRVKVKSVNLSLIDAIVHVLSKKSPVIFCLDFVICAVISFSIYVQGFLHVQ